MNVVLKAGDLAPYLVIGVPVERYARQLELAERGKAVGLQSTTTPWHSWTTLIEATILIGLSTWQWSKRK